MIGLIDRRRAVQDRNTAWVGLLYGLSAYVVWGILPLYWRLLEEVLASEVLAHRVIWSFVLIFLFVIVTGNWAKLRKDWQFLIDHPKQLLALFFAAAVISLNWLLYIWAVNNGRVLETSLGYYINPLLSVLLGVLVLKERLSVWQNVSFLLALCGVLIATFHYGHIPWVSLWLAISFALYGLIKKMVRIDPISGLTLETLFITPFALAYAISLAFVGTAHFGLQSLSTSLLLIGAGAVTVVPLLWFARAAQEISLSTLGFLQYIAPTINLLLGIFVFKESFTLWHFISFLFIWVALALYSLSNTKWFLRWEQKHFAKFDHDKMVGG